jgi:hypothetical protein
MFNQLSDNIQKLIDEIEPLIVTKMKQSEAEIIDMNVEQLAIGKNSLDENMPDYKLDWYAQYKEALGSKSDGRYDLNLEGDYIGAMYAEAFPDGLGIDTKDSKRDKFDYLNPFGLNEKNKEILANELTEPLQTDIEEIFLTGF